MYQSHLNTKFRKNLFTFAIAVSKLTVSREGSGTMFKLRLTQLALFLQTTLDATAYPGNINLGCLMIGKGLPS